jgi:hypothetical protein
MSEPPNRPVPLDSLSKDGVLSAIEEAKDAPTLFSPRERGPYVRERVTEIRRLRMLGQNDEEIKTALGSFVTQYPTLFQMAVEPHFDAGKLEFMLGVRNDTAPSGCHSRTETCRRICKTSRRRKKDKLSF